MNRHQSNPFLAGWEENEVPEKAPNASFFDPKSSGAPEDNASTVNPAQRRYSSSQIGTSSNPYQRPVDRRLLHRNMSSFEAASLHQQMQENGSTEPDCLSGELIAKMTADFKSKINTNEKEFLTDDITIEGFNPFDPFETIVDDDISYPSPASQSNQQQSTEKLFFKSEQTDDQPDGIESLASNEADLPDRPKFELDLENNKTNHDSIDEDEEELVSTPVRNIKSSVQICLRDTNGNIDENHNSLENRAQDANGEDIGSPNDSESTNSMEKAHMFASLLAASLVSSAESALRISEVDEEDELGNHSPDKESFNMECATHVVRGSSAAGDERPVSFFDPFETVIDKDALTSLMNESQKTHVGSAGESSKHSIEDTSDRATCSDSFKLIHTIGDQKSVETVIENEPITNKSENVHESSSDSPKQTSSQSNEDSNSANHCIIPRPEPSSRRNQDQPVAASTYIATKTTQAKKANKPRKKSSSDDSSDSEDDHIKIVIKARDVDKSSEKFPDVPVPLLPPPPSKSTMKQARERGQVEDIPSPIMSKYKKRLEATKDSQDSDSDSEKAKTPNKDSETIQQLQPKILSQEIEQKDDDLDDEDATDHNDEFVIRMRSLDEDELGEFKLPDIPLYDEDTSYELEPFPQPYEGDGWTMLLRFPPKKKFTSNRFWKSIGVKVEHVTIQPDSKSKQASKEPQKSVALQIFNKLSEKKPMQEIPLEPTYTVSDISSQQFDQFGKLFTIKLQYVFYKERVGVRQGQLARFIHSGHIGSSTTSGGHGVDPISVGAIKRLGAPIEHSPQISQIVKLGSSSYSDIREFKNCLEDHLFRMPLHRDKPITTYKTEEVQMVVRDETYIELNQVGQIVKQLARVRLFYLSFLNGMPTVEVGINDIIRQGKEVVGRMDILPVVTEEWIRLEGCELHSVVDKEEFENTESRLIKFIPPDATFFELMRFRVRPPKNQELPLQISANMSVTRTKVSIDVNVMVPGSVSRKYGPIPCENIAIRVQIPECWIYQFREEKHFRMGSKKSVKNTPGRIKGMSRFLSGGVGGGSGASQPALEQQPEASGVIVVTSGQAKYEHHHNAIVWRAARWPKESQSAYVQNSMKIHLGLTAYDTMPDNFNEYINVEYSMPATTVSHTTLRSISVNPYEDEPAEKFVKYSAKYEYKVKMVLSVNLSSRLTGDQQPEASPIVIIKREQDLASDLQREEDSDDDDDDEDDDDNDNHDNEDSEADRNNKNHSDREH